MQITLQRNVALLFGLGLVIWIGSGLVTWRCIQEYDRSAAAVTRAHQVIDDLEAARAQLASAVAVQRAFLLSADNQYYERYTDRVQEARRHYAALKSRVADNPEQARLVDKLVDAMEARLTSLQGDIDFRRAHGLEATVHRFKNSEDLSQSNILRDRILQIRNAETFRLTQNKLASSSWASRTFGAFYISIAVNLLILIVVYISIRRTMAERYLAETKLLRSEQRYRSVTENAADVITVLDTHGIIDYISPSSATVFGYYPAEIEGTDAFKLVHPDDLAHAQSELQEVATTPAAVRTIECRLRHRDGSWRAVEAVAQKAQEEGGGIVVNTRDVTERKAITAALDTKAKDLQRSNAELEQFAYVASHDLQEPLRMVASFAQLLEKRYRGKLDNEADEFIGFIVDGANRMQQLIQDLLSYSRVGTRGERFKEVDTNEIVRRALGNLGVALKESGGEVIVGELPTLWGDAMQLTQLFQNLIGNALKFRGERKPRIEVQARKMANVWNFTVSDNGIGIEDSYRERIFVIFQRLHGREAYSGTGIGLAICRKIVERHGGRIGVESEPGVGSTFEFTLALHRQPVEDDAAS